MKVEPLSGDSVLYHVWLACLQSIESHPVLWIFSILVVLVGIGYLIEKTGGMDY